MNKKTANKDIRHTIRVDADFEKKLQAAASKHIKPSGSKKKVVADFIRSIIGKEIGIT